MQRAVCAIIALFACAPAGAVHSADYIDSNGIISLTELLRVIQHFSTGSYACDGLGEDGFTPGGTPCDSAYHDSDYSPADGVINLPELLRLVQLFNAGAYATNCDTEDGFAPTNTPFGACKRWDSLEVVTEVPRLPQSRPFAGAPVAGAGQQVQFEITTAGIDLSTASLQIVPESALGPTDPRLTIPNPLSVSNFNVIASDRATVVWTVPETSCIDTLLIDGWAEVYLIEAGAAISPAAGYNGLLIDTLPPTLGTLNGVPASQRSLNGSDGLVAELNGPPLFVPQQSVPQSWPPLLNAGNAPANSVPLGDEFASEVFFNWTANFLPSEDGTDPGFTIRVPFVDYGPEACDGGFGPLVAVAGMDPSVMLIGDETNFDVDFFKPENSLGSGFFSTGDTNDLSTGAPLTATLESYLDTTDGFENLIAQWTISGFIYVPSWTISLVLGATDLAGNEFEFDAPVVFYWYPDAPVANNVLDGSQVVLQGPEDPVDPLFTWGLALINPPDAPAPCAPIASFRLWVPDDPVQPLDSYSAITPWTAYRTEQTIDRDTELTPGQTLGDVLDAHPGERILLSLKVADIAGNFYEETATGPARQALDGDTIADFREWSDSAVANKIAAASWVNFETP